MAEFATRRDEENSDLQVILNADGDAIASFDFTCDGETVFSLFVIGALANGHTVWDMNQAQYLTIDN